MIAYDKTGLFNLFVQQQTQIAFEDHCLSKEEKENILFKHPESFYTPNIFIRIGLFILTNIIMLFSAGLFTLIFLSIIEETASALTIIFSVLLFVALEYMIRTKKHFQSGVDDALVWGAAITLFCGISLPNNFGGFANCFLIFIISTACMLRYADRLMAVVSFTGVLGMIFFACSHMGSMAKAILPFIIMIVSLITYIIVKRINTGKSLSVYSDCMTMVEIVSLLTLYIAGNYWVVRETSNIMFNMQLLPGQSIPFGFLFWIFTAIIPLIYLFFGIKKKDAVLLRTGLLLIAAIIFTVRYYHAILPLDIAMLCAGIIMVLIAWALIRYLRVPKHGFTEQALRPQHVLENMHIESLVIAETFSPAPQSNDGNQFGGGSFGGGGTSGEF